MKRLLFILSFFAFFAIIKAQPYGYLQAKYPSYWDKEYEYIGVFDGIDDYINSNILTGPFVDIEMEVKIKPGNSLHSKLFGGTGTNYYSMGIGNDLIYSMAGNSISNIYMPVPTNEWHKVKLNPRRGIIQFGDSANTFTKFAVSSVDSLIFGAESANPNTYFANYEWKTIKIWQRNNLTHFLVPTPDGVKNLKAVFNNDADSILFNKAGSTNYEPIALRYNGYPDSIQQKSTYFDGTANAFASFTYDLGTPVQYDYSFKFKSHTLDQSCVLISDRSGSTANVEATIGVDEKLNINIETASGLYTLNPPNDVFRNVVYEVSIKVDDTAKSITITGDLGSNTITYEGSLTSSLNSVHIGGDETTGFNGELWDLNFNNEFYIPNPHFGIGYSYDEVTEDYNSFNITRNAANVYGLDRDYGSEWLNSYGYVYDRLNAHGSQYDDTIPNNPFSEEAFTLLNGDIWYPKSAGEITTGVFVAEIGGSDLQGDGSFLKPYRTITKAMNEATVNDSIRVFPGTYKEELVFNEAGTHDAPTYIESYNPNNRARLVGNEFIRSGWDVYEENGNTLYSVYLGLTDVNFIFIGDSVYQKARFPKTTYEPRTGESGDDPYTFSNVIDATHVQHPWFDGKDFTGSELVTQRLPWAMDFAEITDHVGSTLTISGFNGTPSTYTEFFVQNDRTLFEEDFDWIYRDDSLIVRSNVTHMNAFDVGIPELDIAIDYDESDLSAYLEIKNLDIFGYNKNAITFTNNGSITLDGCNITKSGGAIYTRTSTAQNVTIANCNILDMMGDGVQVFGRPDSLIVNRNVIRKIGYEGLGDKAEVYRYSGVEGGGTDLYEANYNTIDDIIYNGMAGVCYGDIQIAYNLIQNTNHVLPDGSGLYVPSGQVNNYAQVHDNILIKAERGLYIDNPNRYYDVYRNMTAYNVFSGSYLHDNNFGNFYNNTFYANEKAIHVQVQNGTDTIPTELQIYNNLTWTEKDYDYAFQYGLASATNAATVNWADAGFGLMDSNIHFIHDSLADAFRFVANNATGAGNFNYEEYQALGYEPNGTFRSAVLPRLVYNESPDSSTFYFNDWDMLDGYGNWHRDSIEFGPRGFAMFVDSALNFDITDVFYVDAVNGDDSRSGITLSQSKKTLASAMEQVWKGDTIFLLPGDYLIEETITNFGSHDEPFVIMSYDKNNPATLTGIKTVTPTDWDIYVEDGKTMHAYYVGAPTVNFMMHEGEVIRRARYPNSTTEQTYFDVIVDSALTKGFLNDYDLVGAEVVLQTSDRSFDWGAILSQQDSTIIMSSNANANSYTEWYVQNAKDLMATDLDWIYRDDSLIVMNNTTSDFSVDIPVSEIGISAETVGGYFKLKDLHFTGFNRSAVELFGVGSVEIEGCTINYCGQGVYGYSATTEHLKFNDNLMHDMMGDGLNVFGRPDSVTMNGNTVYNIGHEGLGDTSSYYRFVGLEAGYNDFFQANDNRIYKTMYSGIAYLGTGEVEIARNVIDSTNYVLIDGGGITATSGISSSHANIHDNIIRDGYYGIMVDNDMQYVDLSDNVILDQSNVGIFLVNCDYINAYDNTIWTSEKNIYLTLKTNSTLPTGVNIYNNVSYVEKDFDYAFQYGLANFTAAGSDFSDIGFGSIYDNQYMLFANDDCFWLTGGSGIPDMGKQTLAGLQAKGYETGSTYMIPSDPELLINDTDSPITITFTGFTKTDIDGTDYVDEITIPAKSSVPITTTTSN